MELIIQLYQYHIRPEDTPNKQIAKQIRQYEINCCLLLNIHNPIVNHIHILLEDEGDLAYYTNLLESNTHSRAYTFSVFGKQPSYADLVLYVKEKIPQGKIVCIQNSDIYFGDSIDKQYLEQTVTDNTLVTLTRHEEQDTITSVKSHSNICNETTCPLIWDYQGSHDSFLFRTPVPDNLPIESLSIPQNIFGGEAVFMKAWKDAGKQLLNPCFDIPVFHKHRHHIYFKQYDTIANGYLANASPMAPRSRPELQTKLKTLFSTNSQKEI